MGSRNWQRRSLGWIAGLAGAVTVAAIGSTTVLADEAACVVGGTPVTAEQLAADPHACDAASPAEAEPAADPAPAEPEPAVEPTPEAPEPPEPTPTQPTPAPDPATPAPTEPTPPTEPPTTDTGGAQDPVRSTQEEPGSSTPTTEEPAPAPDPDAERPVRRPVRHAKPARHKHAHEDHGDDTDAATPFRDAGLHRERFEAKGRIPEQPTLAEAQADVLVEAARGTGTDWSTLAAIAWIDSRWGDPVAGGLLGRRLDDADWRAHGTDGDADGRVDRASDADRAATVAAFLAAHDGHGADGALRAYFAGPRARGIAWRARLYADYFDALGTEAIVHGLDDDEARSELADRLLDDLDVSIYEGGRSDIRGGYVDPRVLVTIAFLENRFDSITISSLISGHGVFTASGNVSLHSRGGAVDIAALGGETINGHQQRGSRTYRAIRQVLLLPEAMQPAELISLWELGGPSFALSDHADHIHIGWKPEQDS